MKASELFKAIEENKKNYEFLPTGFERLDNFLDGGFLRKELIVLGAFTGVGKSIFAGQIFYQIASEGFKSAYFSLEISSELLVARLAGQKANIKPTRIIAGLLLPEEFDKKAEAKAKVTMYDELMDFYDDLYFLSEIEKVIRENKHEFVVIDFIQNIQLANNLEEYARLSYISIQLQRLAKEMNCCILILSQVSNKVAQDGSKDLMYKGSGSIAMVADLGFMLKRDRYQTLDANGNVVGKQKVKMTIKKNRRGASDPTIIFEYEHPGGLIRETELIYES